MAISGTQWHSWSTSGNQWQSVALTVISGTRCNQWHSVALGGIRMVINGTQWHSVVAIIVLSGNHCSPGEGPTCGLRPHQGVCAAPLRVADPAAAADRQRPGSIPIGFRIGSVDAQARRDRDKLRHEKDRSHRER